ILSSNRIYFFAVGLFLLLGLILLASIEQGAAIRFFSERRSPAGDWFFRYFTQMGEEPIYLLALLGLLFVRFRYALLVPLIGVLVTLVSYLTKQLFAHDRPSVYFSKLGELEDLQLVEGVHLLTGPTSFPSGHTMSAFAIYGFLALLAKRKRWTAPLCFLAALLVGISRIYLVQHFLKDVVLGAAIGTLLALLVYYLQGKIPHRPQRFWDRSLLSLRPIATP
ncbi:MAG: phosphatase PAP2 family protein, partial [Bacteroidota bacterium]